MKINMTAPLQESRQPCNTMQQGTWGLCYKNTASDKAMGFVFRGLTGNFVYFHADQNRIGHDDEESNYFFIPVPSGAKLEITF
jgi:hypothetical protein